MRLGGYQCKFIDENSISAKAYQLPEVRERHRHRYVFNNQFRTAINAAGLKVVGVNEERNLVEVVELENHPWFVGVQFHPEFRSRPDDPHPLFKSFVKAALDNKARK